MLITRRNFVAAAAASAIATPAFAALNEAAFFAGVIDDHNHSYRKTNFSVVDTVWHRQLVRYTSSEQPGTIVVDTAHHFLYVIFENNSALRYGVGVGREGFQWFGDAEIQRKQVWPDWVPPPAMLVRRPELPKFMAGGIDNPLGPRAMYLFRDGQDLGYRLHGTVEPWSIGGDVSSGCIRMFPEDVVDLYQRSPVGTRVQVLKHLASAN